MLESLQRNREADDREKESENEEEPNAVWRLSELRLDDFDSKLVRRPFSWAAPRGEDALVESCKEHMFVVAWGPLVAWGPFLSKDPVQRCRANAPFA